LIPDLVLNLISIINFVIFNHNFRLNTFVWKVQLKKNKCLAKAKVIRNTLLREMELNKKLFLTKLP